MYKHLVFSDLDGTLLTHQDYDFSPAQESINYLQTQAIPIILSTSKTFDEVVKIQQTMKLKSPFIVENGGGIFIPKECILASAIQQHDDWIKISNTSNYIELRLFFKKMQRHYPIRGFGDMNHEEVMALTHLDRQSVQDAMQRDFTEPFIIEDRSLIPRLTKDAHEEGFDIIEGGRFFHLVSKDQDKAEAMLKLAHLYNEYHDKAIQTIALGDSQNDFNMLNKADIGVLIPKHDGSFAPIQSTKKILHAKHPGPKGWNTAIKEIFDVR